MYLCEHCIQGIRSRELISIGPPAFSAEEAEEEGVTCDWCKEIDDLYECQPAEG